MKRTVITSGLIAGCLVSTFMAISMFYCYKNPDKMMGESSMIIGYLSMLIAFSLIYVGIKSYRDKQNDGLVSFGKAFRIGLYISLIASSIYVLVWAIEYNFFIPDFFDKYSAHMQKLAQESPNAAELKANAAHMEEYKDLYKNPLLFILFTYAEILPVGILVSLISALILKRKHPKTTIIAA
jgi:hypothetical protein